MMSKQFAGKFGDDSDSMDSYADDYHTTESAYISPYGTAVRLWKPRMLSAKRDFPKAFDEVTTHAHSSVSKNELQHISVIGFGVPQLPKRRKVAVVRDFPIGMTGNYKEYVGPVESEEGSTDSGTFHLPNADAKVVSDDLVPFEMDTVSSGSSINREMPGSNHEETDIDVLINTVIRDLADKSTKIVSDDLVPSEMDSMTSGGSINREMLGSDYRHTDLNKLINTDKGRTLDLPYEGAKVVSDDLDYVSSGSSINREMLSSDYEDTDLDQLIKTCKEMIELPYEGARVVSDDLVCEASGSSINREMFSSDYEDTDSDQLIKTSKGTIDLPYEGARVVSDDLVCESSGSSINRDMLSSDYEDTDLDQLIKTRKGTIDLPYEGARVVSDDLVSESSGSSINREMLSSDYEDADLDKLIHTDKGKFDLPYEGAKVVSDDLDSVSGGTSNNREMLSLDEDTDYKEERYKDERTSNEKKVQAVDDMLGPYTELKIHGASVKDIRLNQSQGQIQIQLSIDNLQNYSISIKPSGKESGIHKRAVKRMTTNHTDTRKQLHSRKRVSVVRCFPPGCGPDAAPFTDEELEGAILDSRRHMLICKSCNSL